MEFWCRGKDAVGNILNIGDDGRVALKLVGKRVLSIGRLTEENGVVVYAKNEKTKDIFRETKAWGLCWAVLQRLKDDDLVMIYDERGRLFKQTKKVIAEKGSFLFFKQQGFEKRIFLPLGDWEKSSVKERGNL